MNEAASKDRLSFLNNMIGVYEYTEDSSGNGEVKVLERKQN
jgi:hypothetical protein